MKLIYSEFTLGHKLEVISTRDQEQIDYEGKLAREGRLMFAIITCPPFVGMELRVYELEAQP